MAKKKKSNKKRRKNKGRFLGVLALVLLLSVGLLGVIYLQFFVRDVAPPQVPADISIDFHFRNADGEWAQEERRVPFSETRSDIVESVLQGLVDGPRTPSLLPSLPDGAYVEDAVLRMGAEENVLEVTFSLSFADATPLERIFATASFVWTLTELDFVHHLRFYVGGDPMLDGDGEIFGLRNRQNTTLEESLPPWEDETTVITLYFPDQAWRGLVAEEREIPLNLLQNIERAKVAALFEGPQDPRLDAVFPPDITYNRIEISGIDTVTIDFSEDFLAALEGGSLVEDMIIFSLVNTLTERPDIRRVQISIDGMQMQPDEAGDLHIDLSRPIERDESMIITLP